MHNLDASGPSILARLLCVVLAAGVSGCAVSTREARLQPTAAPTLVEQSAHTRYKTKSCSPYWSWLLPGLGQLCVGKTGEGTALIGLTGAEIAGIATLGSADIHAYDGAPVDASGLPALALQDVWIYAIADSYIEVARAHHELYAPQENLGQLVAAPFNVDVLEKPYVWGGIVGLAALALGFNYLYAGNWAGVTTSHGDGPPTFIGQRLTPPAAYSLSGATGVVLFSHVAIAEESLFRGVVQSSIARNFGETKGLIAGSLIFGATHILNSAVLSGDDRGDYLLYAVPFITTVGTYLGASYMWSDYSLSTSVALHFWYDFLLSAAEYVASPRDSMVGMSVSLPF